MEGMDHSKMNHSKLQHSGDKPMDMNSDDHYYMMINDFKKRFYAELALTVPIMLLSAMIQNFMGVHWQFSGSQYILFGLATFVVLYGGWPFLKGLASEVRPKNTGMMFLIGFAITVAYSYSTAIVFGLQGMDFY